MSVTTNFFYDSGYSKVETIIEIKSWTQQEYSPRFAFFTSKIKVVRAKIFFCS